MRLSFMVLKSVSILPLCLAHPFLASNVTPMQILHVPVLPQLSGHLHFPFKFLQHHSAIRLIIGRACVASN